MSPKTAELKSWPKSRYAGANMHVHAGAKKACAKFQSNSLHSYRNMVVHISLQPHADAEVSEIDYSLNSRPSLNMLYCNIRRANDRNAYSLAYVGLSHVNKQFFGHLRFHHICTGSSNPFY